MCPAGEQMTGTAVTQRMYRNPLPFDTAALKPMVKTPLDRMAHKKYR